MSDQPNPAAVIEQNELAAAIVASCTTDSAVLPRALYGAA